MKQTFVWRSHVLFRNRHGGHCDVSITVSGDMSEAVRFKVSPRLIRNNAGQILSVVLRLVKRGDCVRIARSGQSYRGKSRTMDHSVNSKFRDQYVRHWNHSTKRQVLSAILCSAPGPGQLWTR